MASTKVSARSSSSVASSSSSKGVFRRWRAMRFNFLLYALHLALGGAVLFVSWTRCSSRRTGPQANNAVRLAFIKHWFSGRYVGRVRVSELEKMSSGSGANGGGSHSMSVASSSMCVGFV